MRKITLLLSISILCMFFPSIYFQTLYGQDQKSSVNSSPNLSESTIEKSIPPQSTTSPSHKLKVVSSFYPIYEFVKKIGGDKIDSLILIPSGIEPHDFEPTINQIQAANSADALVFNGLGFESWIDKINTKNKIDATSGINASYINNRTKNFDPHIWLDPVFAKKEIENIRDGLIKIDPASIGIIGIT